MHVCTQAEFAGRHDRNGCPSLDLWAECLPSARVCGFDIVDFTARSNTRARLCRRNPGRREDLESFARECGPFDVIFDDDSHASHHQPISLGTPFPHPLLPGPW